MSLSPKVIILAAVIILAMVFLLVLTVASKDGVYYLTLEEFQAHPDQERGVRIAGFVLDGSIQKEAGGLAVSFVLRDQPGRHRLPVRFDARSAGGRIPDTFTDSSQVVVAGKLDPQGVFQATQLLAKCPSKYQARPAPAPPAVAQP